MAETKIKAKYGLGLRFGHLGKLIVSTFYKKSYYFSMLHDMDKVLIKKVAETKINAQKIAELITYLEKHKVEIIDYGKRQKAGKTIGSGRMEKGVEQVIGYRQKKKGMSWSQKGSKSLGILKVAELNNKWEELWFSKYTASNSESHSSSILPLASNY